MIAKKMKRCDGPCKELRVIWKNHEGKRYCKQCWSCHEGNVKQNKPTVKQSAPIPHRSEKRSKEERLYSAKRIIFLTEKPMCEIHLVGCTNTATDVHHTYSGKDRNEYFLEEFTWKSACRFCHNWIHDHPKESRELDYLK